jgi:hypothetical protein
MCAGEIATQIQDETGSQGRMNQPHLVSTGDQGLPCRQAGRSLEKRVNTAMVLTYYEIGHLIIMREQGGEKRAKYGKQILQGLSEYLEDLHLRIYG